MATILQDRWVSDLDRAVEHLRAVAVDLDADDPMRPRVEATSDRLASYALAVRNVAEAGVSTERVAALIERAWRDVDLALTLPPRARPTG